MNDINRMIAVMQAAKEGKAIQSRRSDYCDIDENWKDTPEPIWNWDTYDYRVKPAELRRI